jgi:DNA-binding NarL/FixJ family response regulator
MYDETSSPGRGERPGGPRNGDPGGAAQADAVHGGPVPREPAIRIALVDDHPKMISGIKQELSQLSWAEVVATGKSGLDAIDIVERYRPDVLVLDVSMPGITGDRAAEELRDSGLLGPGKTQIVAHSAFNSSEKAKLMLDAGAAGYVLKDELPHVLHDAIRGVHAGKSWWTVDPHVVEPANLTSLTPREMEISEMVADGRENDEIAAALSISTDTVRTHIKKAKKKLGVSTIRQFVAKFWKTNSAQP